jgi:hypothetical protein
VSSTGPSQEAAPDDPAIGVPAAVASDIEQPVDPTELPIPGTDAAGGSTQAAHPKRAQADDGDRGVAILLAITAVVAAWITFVAVTASSDAGGDWQSALRQEVARGAAAVEAIRYVYGVEAPAALQVTTEQVLADAARAAAASADPSAAAALEAQAEVADQVRGLLEPNAEMARPAYALEGGGYDPVRRLADSLATEAARPDAVVRHPDAQEAAGDVAAARVNRLMLAIQVVSLAFLFGALAQAWRPWRRPLLAVGTVALVIGGVLALVGGLLG